MYGDDLHHCGSHVVKVLEIEARERKCLHPFSNTTCTIVARTHDQNSSTLFVATTNTRLLPIHNGNLIS